MREAGTEEEEIAKGLPYLLERGSSDHLESISGWLGDVFLLLTKVKLLLVICSMRSFSFFSFKSCIYIICLLTDIAKSNI